MTKASVSPARRRGEVWRVAGGMDETQAVDRAQLLRALADPTRLSMLAQLSQAPGGVCICDLTATYGLSQPTISHHMAKLRAAGLVESSRSGIWVYYRVAPQLAPTARRLLSAAIG